MTVARTRLDLNHRRFGIAPSPVPTRWGKPAGAVPALSRISRALVTRVDSGSSELTRPRTGVGAGSAGCRPPYDMGPPGRKTGGSRPAENHQTVRCEPPATGVRAHRAVAGGGIASTTLPSGSRSALAGPHARSA